MYNNPSRHHNTSGGSTNRPNVHPAASQPGPLPVAQRGAHTSANHDGAFIARDTSNLEVADLEQRMNHLYVSRGPPDRKPTGVPDSMRQRPQSSRTQPQTIPYSEVQRQVQRQGPAAFPQGRPVATPTGNRQLPPPNQTTGGQTLYGQMPQASHGQKNQVPLGQMHPVSPQQAPDGHTNRVSQVQTYQGPDVQAQQVPHEPHVQTYPAPHAQTYPAPYAQMHQVPLGQPRQVPYGQIPQPPQVQQMPRATHGGTSSNDQQRSADRRTRNDRPRAVTAYQQTTAG